MTVVLRDNAAALGVALYRHVVGHGVAADDSCAGMHAFATHVSFNGARVINNRLHLGVVFVFLFEVGVRLQRFVDGNAQLIANKLGNLVAHRIRIPQHARGIAHGVFRLQLAKRDNAGNVVFAVDFLDVVDNFLATFIFEVNVDIGHFHAFRGKEALEHQAVGNGVQVGDAHGVRNNSACRRATTRANANTLAARP